MLFRGCRRHRIRDRAKRALFDNLGRDEELALKVDAAVRGSRQDGWRSNALKIKRVRLAIKAAVEARTDGGDAAAGARWVREASQGYGAPAGEAFDASVDMLLELAKNQNEY